MDPAIVRQLRRIVDALQRSLFDDVDDDASPAPPRVAVPSPGTEPAPQRGVARRSVVLAGGRTVAFVLKRSSRRTIGFVVGDDGLVVTAPRRVSLAEIDAAVREKGRWIGARLDEQAARAATREASRIVWADGATLPFLGETIRLSVGGGVSPERAVGAVALAAAATADAPRTLHVGLPKDAGAARVRDAVHGWLQREARRVFEARVAHYAERLGVVVTRLSLSSASTRWGSANSRGAIRLHWRLVHYALPTIDYVVAHELAHLREMNHGPRFWNLVRSVVPDVEGARADLKQGSLTLDD